MGKKTVKSFEIKMKAVKMQRKSEDKYVKNTRRKIFEQLKDNMKKVKKIMIKWKNGNTSLKTKIK